ncbi:hypothetical protein VII00023_10170 [Vibrio ichthyoenteri ATCC 700023]|uniref:Uncharacterized protein n=1 Tax=Vibrio ichthyoenteri ATCC 700023 TaxID=870968 RepID=F9RWE1_9VIBR|nr:hypothetical protein [Vibrio ichthyoenteri]EGU49394.1 hypothetical protein VII00023_10170 [Vibrio ichthyoenteri ATCC 700023]
MFKFNLHIRYTNQKENTELNVEANYESSELQNDQSPRSKVGLVLDYVFLAVNILSTVPILLDTVSNLI